MPKMNIKKLYSGCYRIDSCFKISDDTSFRVQIKRMDGFWVIQLRSADCLNHIKNSGSANTLREAKIVAGEVVRDIMERGSL
jgi:hypothetical protein